MESAKRNSASAFLACALTSLFAFILALRKVENFDIWWHLKVGELMLSNMTVLREDPFSHTLSGTQWLPFQWLAEVIFYIVYSLGNIELLGIFSASIIATTALLIWCRARNFGVNPWLIALVVVFILPVAHFRFMIRPHIFFYLMISLLLYLIEKNISTDNKKCAWGTVVLLICWVNIHGSYPLAFIYIAAWTIFSFFKKRNSYHLYILAAATVAFFLRPGSFETILSIVTHLSEVTVRREVLNEEFMPTKWGEYRLFWNYAIISFLLIIFTAKKKMPQYMELLAYSTTLLLALTSIRYIALFAIATAPYSAMRIHVVADLLKKKIPSSAKLLLERYDALYALPITLVMAFSLMSVYGPSKSYRWGLGVNENFYPVSAVQFLEKSGLQDIRLYNSKRFGGYLIWRLFPRFRVALDGRDEIFGELLGRLASTAWMDYQSLMKEYRFQVAVIGYRKYNGFESLIEQDREWVLVYWDDLSRVYARRGEVPDDFISRYAYEYFTPNTMDSFGLISKLNREKSDKMLSELKRAIAGNPESFKSWFYLGNVLEHRGELQNAAAAYEKALAANEKLAAVHYNISAKLGTLYLSLNNPSGARKAFEKHFIYNSETGKLLYPYGISLYKLKDFKAAEIRFKKYIKEQPNDFNALADYGFLLLDMQRYEEAINKFKAILGKTRSSIANYGLALTYQKMGDCDNARPLWKNVINSDLSKQWTDKAGRYLAKCGG